MTTRTTYSVYWLAGQDFSGTKATVRIMEMKQYLLETFRYNNYANKLALAKIGEIPEKGECIKLFSHLINSMNKWLGRIEKWPGYAEMDWWKPEYGLDELEAKWDECLKRWLDFIASKNRRRVVRGGRVYQL